MKKFERAKLSIQRVLDLLSGCTYAEFVPSGILISYDIEALLFVPTGDDPCPTNA